MAVISAQAVRDRLDEMAAWAEARWTLEMKRFIDRQGFVAAYALALAEDEGREAVGFALQVGLTIDAVYRHALGRPPRRITERMMETAGEDAEKGFEQLGNAEPELAMRRMLAERDLAEPELLIELINSMMEEAEENEDIERALGVVFLITKAFALAYERANGLATAREGNASLGEALEQRIGRPLPKIGRNTPCPCGSGQKFKKCCGRPAAQQPPAAAFTETQVPASLSIRRFSDYMAMVERVLRFYNTLRREADGRWLERQSEQFVKRFRPGDPDGVPDSMHVGYLALDQGLPASGKSVCQLFAEREARNLGAPERALLRELADSYVAFYEVVEKQPDGKQQLRQLGTNARWLVSDVDDPLADLGDAGEIWMCRLVGPPDDAVTLMVPLVYPAEACASLEELVLHLIKDERAAGLALGDAMRLGMKRAIVFMAEYILLDGEKASAGEEDVR